MSANYETASVSATMQGVVAFIHRTQPIVHHIASQAIFLVVHKDRLGAPPLICLRQVLDGTSGITEVCPDPHSARAKLVRYESIRQDWTKEGQRKGHSGHGRQGAARRLPDPQGEKKIP